MRFLSNRFRIAATGQGAALVVVLQSLAPHSVEAVSTQKVVHRTPADFGAGELEKVQVSDLGVLSLAPGVERMAQVDDPIIWDLALDSSGGVLLGTGSDGHLYRYDPDGGSLDLLADFEEQQVTAVAVAPDGTVLAGVSPGARIYALRPDVPSGTAPQDAWTVAGEFEAGYLWDLEVSPDGRVFVAAGDPGGVFVGKPGGTFESILDTDEAHVLALALHDDTLLAGSANSGYVYRVDLGGRKRRVTVLLDAPGQEARQVLVAPDGAVWVLTLGQEPSDFEEDHVLAGLLGAVDDVAGDPGVDVDTRIYRIEAGRSPECLWHGVNVMGHSLAWQGGRAVLGLGDRGRLVGVSADRHVALLTDIAGEQVTAMVRGSVLWVAASNPAALYQAGARPEESGRFTSEVIDSGLHATWGRIDVFQEEPCGGRVRVETRSGNTDRPDTTWSRWQSATERIQSPPARYLQYRLGLAARGGAFPRVREVDVYYRPANSRPTLEEIQVLDPGIRIQPKEDFRSEPVPRGINQPKEPPAEPQVKKKEEPGTQGVLWKATDPDGDELAYDVALRVAGASTWEPLAHDRRERFINFDAAAMPDGWYQVRVTVRDAPSNLPEEVLSDQRVSAPFPVDHTPPVLRIVSRKERGDVLEVEVEATDETTYLRAARHALDGGVFQPVFPVDGVFDSRVERFQVSVPGIAGDGQGRHVVVVAVEDGVGNVATVSVRVP